MGLIKTTLIVTGGLAVGGVLLLGAGPLSSYLRTSARVAGDNIQNSVPTGFEIERIQTLVADLDAVIAEQQGTIVAQRVDLDYLRAEVERAAERRERLAAEVAEARRLLGIEREHYRINGREHDRATVIAEARSKAEALTRAREIHDAKQQTMQTLTAALDQADRQLRQAVNQREAFAMRLSELRAKAENVEIRRELAVSLDELPEAIDAGAFQEVEAAFRRVERDLAVQDRLLTERYQGQPSGGSIDFAAPEAGDVIAELDRALGRSTSADEPDEPDATPAGEPTAARAATTAEPIAFVPHAH